MQVSENTKGAPWRERGDNFGETWGVWAQFIDAYVWCGHNETYHLVLKVLAMKVCSCWKLFLVMCLYVSMYGYVYTCAGTLGGQHCSRHLPEMELWAVVSCLTWVLRTKLEFPGRTVWASGLNTEPVLHPKTILFLRHSSSMRYGQGVSIQIKKKALLDKWEWKPLARQGLRAV